MLLNKKLKFLLFLTGSIAILTTSCSANSVYLNSVDGKAQYFVNLIKLKQEYQNVTSNNSVIFDQFTNHLTSIVKQNKNSRTNTEYKNFFKDSNFKKITSKKDFEKEILSRINVLYSKIDVPKILSDDEVTKIFEIDFLKGQKLNNVLENKDILIFETKDDRFNWRLIQYLFDFDTNKNNNGKINILQINPLLLSNIKPGIQTTDKLSDRQIFTVMLLPKSKDFEIKYTSEQENDKLFNDLYDKFGYKVEKFIKQQDSDIVNQLIDKIQEKQDIKFQRLSFLGSLKTESLSNLQQNSDILTINNSNEFDEYILNPLLKVSQENQLDLSSKDIKTKFEKEYLNDQGINYILKNNKIIVQRIVNTDNWISLNVPNRIIKYTSDSNKLSLAYVSDRIFNYTFSISDYNYRPKNEIFYQVLVVSKNTAIKTKGLLGYKEANDFLIKNKDL
ncbi:hypothetical protein BCF59_0216 [Mycoplasmopsis mustelae]|uniref:Lipoprotein n=1 Tax=Mycoplasmopsis mustelae TaxID=171289 RepID=A0A4R7UCT4_9BACT|nr:hypothetical protein [Mycoplasmopsis mustelae]TDV24262.1 hypothetical protein BCF59_0216 [Mycoplasmopsis mustelae]